MPRTHSLDNLRTSLTILVIFHHASIPYGGLGSWPYEPSRYSPSKSEGSSRLFLVPFNVVNQTFFMALFFLISGYFSALAAEKRPGRMFLKEKAKRLGVPCVLYSVLGPGVAEAFLAGVRDGAAFSEVVKRSLNVVCCVRGARGPVWYCGVLLLFDTVFALWTYHFRYRTSSVKQDTHLENPEKPVTKGPKPHISYLTQGTIQMGLILAIVASFLLRLYYPIGTTFVPLGLEMGFLPQYVMYYATGIYAQRTLKTELHRVVPRYSVRARRSPGAVSRAVELAVAIGLSYASNLKSIRDLARGGWDFSALGYAMFNEAMGFVFCVKILRLFGERAIARRKWMVGRGFDPARWSYAAFLVHAPVVVGLQCVLDMWAASGVVKSGVVGGLGCLVSWGLGFGLGRGLERVGVRGYI